MERQWLEFIWSSLGAIGQGIEARRVLVISAPNRLTYSDNPKSVSANPNNKFYVNEPYEYQLVSLLSRYFKNVKLYGQRLAIGSFVFPLLSNNLPASIASYTSKKDGLTREFCSLQEPIYFVAVCSDEINHTQKLLDSIFIDDQEFLISVKLDSTLLYLIKVLPRF